MIVCMSCRMRLLEFVRFFSSSCRREEVEIALEVVALEEAFVRVRP